MDLLPKTHIWTAFSYLYIFSTIASMLTLMFSVFAVSLSTTVESVGPMSEVALMNLFLKHDTDNSGTMDADELQQALQLSSLEPAHLLRLTERIDETINDRGEISRTVSMLEWYDIVDKIADSDGLAANHNVMVWCLVNWFDKHMRKVPPLPAVRASSARLDVCECLCSGI